MRGLTANICHLSAHIRVSSQRHTMCKWINANTVWPTHNYSPAQACCWTQAATRVTDVCAHLVREDHLISTNFWINTLLWPKCVEIECVRDALLSLALSTSSFAFNQLRALLSCVYFFYVLINFFAMDFYFGKIKSFAVFLSLMNKHDKVNLREQ